MRITTVPAAILLAGVGAAALLARHPVSAGVLAAVMLGVCLRGGRAGRRLYLFGALAPAVGVFLVWPLLGVEGTHMLWSGPIVPVLGPLDVTVEEIQSAGLYALRFGAVGLAFAAYALLLDHDELVRAFGFARRSALAVALATRLVPTLERDAAGLKEAIRGRGVAVVGLRGHARLLSPLVAGSLERASSLAEAMEARGYGRPGATRAPRPAWGMADQGAVVLAAAVVVAGALWL